MRNYIQYKYLQDPNTVLMSLSDFFNDINPTAKIDLWDETQKPRPDVLYYKFTPDSVIRVKFTEFVTNFGMSTSQKLNYIEYAHRDGVTEFYLLDQKISELEQYQNRYTNAKSKKITKINFALEQLKRIKELLPAYQKKAMPPAKKFKDYLIDTGYKTADNALKNKYIVFDVETNGIRRKNDDLLSISIYDPTTGLCYNRFFPLQLQPLILNTFFHGISDQTLEGSTHITQGELNQIMDYFQLRDKILLSFSGGKGFFDRDFFANYCKRQQVKGFDTLQFENIKSKLPKPGYGFEGQMKKDNLCKLFQIEGVKDIHSGINDCVLEWKLFEKIVSANLFFHDGNLYKYHQGYILPITYLNKNPELADCINISVPFVDGFFETIYSYSLPDEILPMIKKFPTNITGIALENAINSLLDVKIEDNRYFLEKNKSKIEFIGSLESQYKKIPIITQSDGLLKAQDSKDTEYVEQVNQVTKIIMENISPVIEFILNNIFVNEKIKSQELVISPDKKILALCDLSSPTSIMEIKTFNVMDLDGKQNENIFKQLYYQSNGRKIYILSFDFKKHFDMQTEQHIIDGVNISIYHITLEITTPDQKIHTSILEPLEIKILKCIIEYPALTRADIIKNTCIPNKLVYRIFKRLILFGYISKIPNSKPSCWQVLRYPDDIYTKYTYDGNQIHIIETQ